MKFINEDNRDDQWNCGSVRYKFISKEDGYIPTADELNDSVIKAVNLLARWTAEDRYSYLLGEDGPDGLICFGFQKHAVGITIVLHGNDMHLIIAVDKSINTVNSFFESNGFMFTPRRTFSFPHSTF